MQNGRKVFGEIYPNRMVELPIRTSSKKQPKADKKKDHQKLRGTTSQVTIYSEAAANTPESAFVTIDETVWQDLADCTSVLHQESSNEPTPQNQPLEEASEFDLQDFKDVDIIMCDPSSLMQPMSMTDAELPLSDYVSDLEACISTSIPGVHDSLMEMNLPTDHSQPPEQFWKDVAEENQKALGDALEENEHLQVTLKRKQCEIVSLKERNVQLKELASKAKHLASILDKLMKQESQDANDTISENFPSAKRQRVEGTYFDNQDCDKVDEILRDISEKCNVALQTLNDTDPKYLKINHCSGEASYNEIQETINMYGSFNGLQTSVACDMLSLGTSELDNDMSFKTSIRDHCTIRTLAFPQGNAFTTRTPNGGFKFRWIPS
ncbi:multicilin [Heterodontus francisci]|uniref:multicilin n=1 Tax=Heterodontus francisci TaxID=7792 RepID=UPI00355C0898